MGMGIDMELLKKLLRRKQEKPLQELNDVLEIEIFKLLNGAELLLEPNPELGIQFCDQANGLYRWRGYDFKIECRINDVFLSYMKSYSPI
jgi:hypothetical protein